MEEIIVDIPMEDLTPSEPVCNCKKCVVQNIIYTLNEIECSCTYKQVEKTETYTDENGIEQTHTYTVTEVDLMCDRCKSIALHKAMLDKYYALEKANINECEWDNCSIVDDIIYTPTADGKISNNDMIWDTLSYLTSPVPEVIQ